MTRRQPAQVSDRALDQLHYIRQTMEGATAFTAVPGWGGVAIGVSALAAALVASSHPIGRTWTRIWVGEAVVAAAVGVAAMWSKARRLGLSRQALPARRFALAHVPPLVAGAVLTVPLYRMGRFELLPGLWLLLYGTAVITGGALSVRVVPLMGAAFAAAGILALLAPVTWANTLMAASFGGLHIIFGLIIARRHGG